MLKYLMILGNKQRMFDWVILIMVPKEMTAMQ